MMLIKRVCLVNKDKGRARRLVFCVFNSENAYALQITGFIFRRASQC
ncbi:hypothetical protein GPG82_003805 [Salmonella enterica subsp. enterica]|nr:hypothetical protein [Salmonella enterica subsp. enterica serovar Havana]EDQ2456417.1 hypothetical protein [Salmonella enterica subsp. enterica]EDQ3699045.1 hypothetical protein [Salmonella enterica subsp. enterica serovar Ouakam]EDR0863367.1 hypothetical protein [Salmonella enterica subsp. enterica serovar Hillingdon]EDS5244483.1 hypothetical protein [Salmonella enterica subsp. enterica serovar Essen]EDT3272039.1 hypothetical protein [Salmonella enterica subsp. enterica serovar Lome]EDT79